MICIMLVVFFLHCLCLFEIFDPHFADSLQSITLFYILFFFFCVILMLHCSRFAYDMTHMWNELEYILTLLLNVSATFFHSSFHFFFSFSFFRHTFSTENTKICAKTSSLTNSMGQWKRSTETKNLNKIAKLNFTLQRMPLDNWIKVIFHSYSYFISIFFLNFSFVFLLCFRCSRLHLEC